MFNIASLTLPLCLFISYLSVCCSLSKIALCQIVMDLCINKFRSSIFYSWLPVLTEASSCWTFLLGKDISQVSYVCVNVPNHTTYTIYLIYGCVYGLGHLPIHLLKASQFWLEAPQVFRSSIKAPKFCYYIQNLLLHSRCPMWIKLWSIITLRLN